MQAVHISSSGLAGVTQNRAQVLSEPQQAHLKMSTQSHLADLHHDSVGRRYPH